MPALKATSSFPPCSRAFSTTAWVVSQPSELVLVLGTFGVSHDQIWWWAQLQSMKSWKHFTAHRQQELARLQSSETGVAARRHGVGIAGRVYWRLACWNSGVGTSTFRE